MANPSSSSPSVPEQQTELGKTLSPSQYLEEDQLLKQPPFAVAGTHPDQRSSKPPHFRAEQLVDAAAKHVFPTQPAPEGPVEEEQGRGVGNQINPDLKLQQEQSGQNKAGTVTKDQDEQEPLVAGTPLDELRTPVLEKNASYGMPSTAASTSSSSSQAQSSNSTGGGLSTREVGTQPRRTGGRQQSSDSLRPSQGVRPMIRLPEGQTLQDDTGETPVQPGGGAKMAKEDQDLGSIRMGASALFSALNALPWESDGEDSSDSDEEDERQAQADQARMGKSLSPQRAQRPPMQQLHSSLHTIRPSTPAGADFVNVPTDKGISSDHHANQLHPEGLHFPFRANTIARKAKSPGLNELAYQFASEHPEEAQRVAGDPEGARQMVAQMAQGSDPVPRALSRKVEGVRRGSVESDASARSNGSDSVALPLGSRSEVAEQLTKEQAHGEEEEQEEIIRAAKEEQDLPASASSSAVNLDLAPALETAKSPNEEERQDGNVEAALREGTGEDQQVYEGVQESQAEKKRLRRERLAGKLQEVFGLEEREEVLEEMRCWLLRSVMLKGYMYLTKKHICFFAHMPTRENLVVKTGPLSKKASRTKMNNKYWVVLKNDIMSWFESTADPYFPKGNVSLQYASSCEAIDETRFKLRTSERSYTFTADTTNARDEWIKAIQKVMFRVQHQGESVKLIIPLEAILEIEKSPTLEFADTIEVKCVDSEDQMSVDSYFFASFQDNEKAFAAIQKRLDERPSSDLPRVASSSSMREYEADQGEQQLSGGRLRAGSSSSTHLGLKKIGNVLKPLISRSHDEQDAALASGQSSKLSLPSLFRQRSNKSTDSVETAVAQPTTPGRSEETLPIGAEGEAYDGYPPKQTGPVPTGMNEESGKSWAPSWIKKPAEKLLGATPGRHTSRDEAGAQSDSDLSLGMTDTHVESKSAHTRTGRGKRASVTEIIETKEPMIPPPQLAANEAYADSEGEGHSRRPSVSFVTGEGGGSNTPTSVAQGARGHKASVSGTSLKSVMSNKSERSLVGGQEGEDEEEEVARKFRHVFSLPETEELVDHFPGFLYRVLPVSGRFFVSTNYFCFRSSQLLYKTKMIIPIRDLYGLKAQKAFAFGHVGLIVVIKGHEEIFLEFSSVRRREACVSILEEKMEEVRTRSDSNPSHAVDQDMISTRIMEDLDESSPVHERSTSNAPPVSPSPLFGSTTSTFLEFKPDPMTITCLTIGSRGDVQPYIALCKGLQAEGHKTRIATHGEYKDWVEGHGIEFASVGGDPAELMQMCVDNGMFTVSFLKEGLQKFRGWLDDLLRTSWEACQGSDLLIESPSAMGGLHIAEALRIPYYRAFTMPWTRTRAYPHAFAVPEHKRGGSYNYMTYTMFDQVFWRAISGQVNKWRKTVLGIESTTFDKMEQHKVPFLYNFSPSVVPPPLDWTEWIHITGYWFLENADESSAAKKKWTPPEGLLEFIDNAHKNGKKVVYIGFGSIVVSDPQEMTRCVVDAVVDSGVCAILSKGWSDRGSKSKPDDKEKDGSGADGIKYPPEIFSIDSIDHTWLFPRIDAACHHGGAGTSGASLRAGIPTIIKPFFGDQAFWSERVESLNVGSAVRKLTAEHLSEALKKATEDEKQIAKARVVGEMIRKENGVAMAIEAIYRDLEYAKSLIKNPKPSGQGADDSDDEYEDGDGEQGAIDTEGEKKRKMSLKFLHPDNISLPSLVRPRSGSRTTRSRAGSDVSEREEEQRGARTRTGGIGDSTSTSASASSSQDQERERERGSDGSWSVVSEDDQQREGKGQGKEERRGKGLSIGGGWTGLLRSPKKGPTEL